MNQYFYLWEDDNPASFEDLHNKYVVMTRVQVDSIELTWILCRCKSFMFAKYLVDRLNKIWNDISDKDYAEHWISRVLEEEAL